MTFHVRCLPPPCFTSYGPLSLWTLVEGKSETIPGNKRHKNKGISQTTHLRDRPGAAGGMNKNCPSGLNSKQSSGCRVNLTGINKAKWSQSLCWGWVPVRVKHTESRFCYGVYQRRSPLCQKNPQIILTMTPFLKAITEGGAYFL